MSQEAHDGSNRRLGSSQSSASELPADSKFILNTPSPDILTNGVIYEKYLSNEGKILGTSNVTKPKIFINSKKAMWNNPEFLQYSCKILFTNGLCILLQFKFQGAPTISLKSPLIHISNHKKWKINLPQMTEQPWIAILRTIANKHAQYHTRKAVSSTFAWIWSKTSSQDSMVSNILNHILTCYGSFDLYQVSHHAIKLPYRVVVVRMLVVAVQISVFCTHKNLSDTFTFQV